jgi:hypothetical protein
MPQTAKTVFHPGSDDRRRIPHGVEREDRTKVHKKSADTEIPAELFDSIMITSPSTLSLAQTLAEVINQTNSTNFLTYAMNLTHSAIANRYR